LEYKIINANYKTKTEYLGEMNRLNSWHLQKDNQTPKYKATHDFAVQKFALFKTP
jgi:hypothetical protein